MLRIKSLALLQSPPIVDATLSRVFSILSSIAVMVAVVLSIVSL